MTFALPCSINDNSTSSSTGYYLGGESLSYPVHASSIPRMEESAFGLKPITEVSAPVLLKPQSTEIKLVARPITTSYDFYRERSSDSGFDVFDFFQNEKVLHRDIATLCSVLLNPAPVNSPYLDEALGELEELEACASEEELKPPAPTAKDLAERILEEFARKFPRYFSVSLWEEGDIVVTTSESARRVSVFCRANGGASLYVSTLDGTDYEYHCRVVEKSFFQLVDDALKNLPT